MKKNTSCTVHIGLPLLSFWFLNAFFLCLFLLHSFRTQSLIKRTIVCDSEKGAARDFLLPFSFGFLNFWMWIAKSVKLFLAHTHYIIFFALNSMGTSRCHANIVFSITLWKNQNKTIKRTQNVAAIAWNWSKCKNATISLIKASSMLLWEYSRDLAVFVHVFFFDSHKNRFILQKLHRKGILLQEQNVFLCVTMLIWPDHSSLSVLKHALKCTSKWFSFFNYFCLSENWLNIQNKKCFIVKVVRNVWNSWTIYVYVSNEEKQIHMNTVLLKETRWI